MHHKYFFPQVDYNGRDRSSFEADKWQLLGGKETTMEEKDQRVYFKG